MKTKYSVLTNSNQRDIQVQLPVYSKLRKSDSLHITYFVKLYMLDGYEAQVVLWDLAKPL